MKPEDFTVHATGPLLEDATVRYIINSKSSSFVVKAFSRGLLSAFGHDPKIAIREFQGNASFTPNGGALDAARVDIRIQASSLEVADDVSDKDRQEINHRMHTEVLETDRFPEIVYECSQCRRQWRRRPLLGGVEWGIDTAWRHQCRCPSRREWLSRVTLCALPASSWSVKVSMRLLQVSAAGGAIRVKDELKCTFDIVARKQE